MKIVHLVTVTEYANTKQLDKTTVYDKINNDTLTVYEVAGKTASDKPKRYLNIAEDPQVTRK